MSRLERERLQDILSAIDAIKQHMASGDLGDGPTFDAVRMRLIEIGEAVKALPSHLRLQAPDVDWSALARMRDNLAHKYFDTAHAAVQGALEHDLPELERAVHRLLEEKD